MEKVGVDCRMYEEGEDKVGCTKDLCCHQIFLYEGAGKKSEWIAGCMRGVRIKWDVPRICAVTKYFCMRGQGKSRSGLQDV